MTVERRVELFSAGCPICEDLSRRVKAEACPRCDLTVHDMHAASGARRARELGVRSVPAVAIDGRLVACCAGAGPDMETLRAAGLGRPA